MMTIHINADLRPIVKERVGMLHWVMDPLVSGFIIAYDLAGNQVLICNFDVCLLFLPPHHQWYLLFHVVREMACRILE